MLHLKIFSETLFLAVENGCVFKLSLRVLVPLEINTKKTAWSRVCSVSASQGEGQGRGWSLAGACALCWHHPHLQTPPEHEHGATAALEQERSKPC